MWVLFNTRVLHRCAKNYWGCMHVIYRFYNVLSMTHHLEEAFPILVTKLPVRGYDLLDFVVAIILVLVTAVTGVIIWQTFKAQNNVNSAKLCNQFYDEIMKDYRGIWSEMGKNKFMYGKKNIDHRNIIKYNTSQLSDFLNKMEMVSVLVVKNIIGIEYAYEAFSTIYFAYDYDLQIRSYIDEGNNDGLNTYHNNYVQAANLCTKYYDNNKKLNFLDRVRR